MQSKSLVGIYGGAFDPIHRDHLRLMRYAIEELGLSRLVLVPSAAAPHKTTATPFANRVEMLRIATEGLPVVIDEVERDWQGKAYSSEVLPVMLARYGDIVHIIGGDSLADMPTWHCPEQVMRYPTAVVARGEDERLPQALAYAKAQYHANVRVLEHHATTYSSTAIRQAYRIGCIPYVGGIIGAQVAATYGVEEAVHDYIVTHDLYHEYGAILDEVPRHISPKRWAHTQEVAKMALRLNRSLKLEEDKVIKAALLHDCMKGAEQILAGVPKDVLAYPPVVHAFNGAEEARLRYGVDEDVANAIRYHTTGRAAMSDLERLIYLADMVEATRTFPGVEGLREKALSDFDAGFVAAVRYTHDYLLQSDHAAHPLGEACYQYYTRSDL